MTSLTWSFPFASWDNEEDGMSKVADNLDPRGGMMKPAAVPSQQRKENGELAQRTGRVLPSPDSYLAQLPMDSSLICDAGYDS